MSTYLVVKYNNSNKSYTAKDNIPNKPYINISNKYFPLTTETSGTGIKVKINNNIYKIIESYTTTINTTYKSDYTYKNTYSQSWKINYHVTDGDADLGIAMSIGMQPNNFRVNRTVNFSITRVRSTKYTSRTITTSNSTSFVVSGTSVLLTKHALYKEITYNELYTNEVIQLSVQGTTNDSATYVSFSSSARATNRNVNFLQISSGLNNNKYDTIASTVNSTRQGNTTTTTTSQ